MIGAPGAARIAGCLLIAGLAAGALSCRTSPKPSVARPIDASLRELLPQLAKGHSDKIQLAGFAGMPVIHRLDPAVRRFTDHMGQVHKELLAELRQYAKSRNMSLKFSYSDDPVGHAMKRMEQAQGDELRSASNEDFERLVVVLMYTDYAWQRSLVNALLERSPDPALRPYLEKSRQAHDEGLRQIEDLLRQYKLRK